MNSKHRKTLQAIYDRPTRASLDWASIEALFLALGGAVKEGSGSRMRVSLSGVSATFHRPHPGPLAKKGVVDAVREFLRNAGVKP